MYSSTLFARTFYIFTWFIYTAVDSLQDNGNICTVHNKLLSLKLFPEVILLFLVRFCFTVTCKQLKIFVIMVITKIRVHYVVHAELSVLAVLC